MAKVTVKGLTELAAKLDVAAMRVHAAAVEAVRQEVDAVGDDAQKGAPVKSGELRDGVIRQAADTKGRVDSTARHSTFVEHGTYKDPAQPFMGPAAERSRVRWPVRAASLIRSSLGGK